MLPLMFLTIERAYKPVTSDDRRRMREEREQRAHEIFSKPEAAK